MRLAALLGAVLLLGAGGVAAARLLATGTKRPAHRGAGSVALRGEATWAPGAAPAPLISGLRDQRGRGFSLSSLRGRAVAIAFFDSYCNQACPLEGRALAAALAPLPRARRPTIVIVSVNPRDTRASTRAAARKWGLARVAPWHWLRGSRAQLARAWRAYRIFVSPRPIGGDIVHTEALYLLDRAGYERSAYLYPFATRFVTGDLRVLAGAARGA